MWWWCLLNIVTHTLLRSWLRERNWIICLFNMITSAAVTVSALTWQRRLWNSRSSHCCICLSRIMMFVNQCQISWSRVIRDFLKLRICHSDCALIEENWWKFSINNIMRRASRIAVEFCWTVWILLHYWLMKFSIIKLIMLISSMIMMLFSFHSEYVCELIFDHGFAWKLRHRAVWIVCPAML